MAELLIILADSFDCVLPSNVVNEPTLHAAPTGHLAGVALAALLRLVHVIASFAIVAQLGSATAGLSLSAAGVAGRRSSSDYRPFLFPVISACAVFGVLIEAYGLLRMLQAKGRRAAPSRGTPAR